MSAGRTDMNCERCKQPTETRHADCDAAQRHQDAQQRDVQAEKAAFARNRHTNQRYGPEGPARRG